MKGEGVSDDVLDHFMSAFEALVRSNLSQEVLRSMSLFITYAFHTPPPSALRTPRPLSAISRSSTPGLGKRGAGDISRTHSPSVGSKLLSRKLLGKRVLSMYSEILCEKGNVNNVKKFGRTVTNKVSYLARRCIDVAILKPGSGCFTCWRMTMQQLSSTAAKSSPGFSWSRALRTQPSFRASPGDSQSWRTG